MAGQGESGEDAPERSDAESWLLELLKEGSVPAKRIFQDAEDCGFSRHQIKRAKQKLKAGAQRTTGDEPHWRWFLPEAKGAHCEGGPETGAPLHPMRPLFTEPEPDAQEGRRELTSSLKELIETTKGGKGRKGAESQPHRSVPLPSRAEPSTAASPVGAEGQLPAPRATPPPPIPISAAPSYGQPTKEVSSDHQPATSTPEIDAHDVALLDFYKRAANEGIDIPAPKHARQKRMLKQYGFDRDLIDLESWPGPWCPHCTEEPVQREDDLCPSCETELQGTAKRWRA